MPDEVGLWWCISEEGLLELLRRAAAGENPEAIYAEEYANSEHEHVEGEDKTPSTSGACGCEPGWVGKPAKSPLQPYMTMTMFRQWEDEWEQHRICRLEGNNAVGDWHIAQFEDGIHRFGYNGWELMADNA